MDLAPLADEFTFGLNRIYLLFDQWGFETTFLVAINRYVIEQFGPQIANTAATKVLNWSYRVPELDGTRTAYLETRVAFAPSGGVLSGYYAGAGTVTSLGLQLAHFMGFSEVILIGVDHQYQQGGVPNVAVQSAGEDRSHFSRDYFGRGVTWQLPDLSAMERGYHQCRRLFEASGRTVLDATLDGQLRVFPKASIDRVLRESRALNRTQFLSSGRADEDHPA
jgi:hypothetical protein